MSVVKLIRIKRRIWPARYLEGYRNTDAKQLTFRQKHAPGFIQRNENYFFISNSQQEVINHAGGFISWATPVTISTAKNK